MLSIGLILGVAFKLTPIKSLKRRVIELAVFSLIAGVGLAIPAWFYSASLLSINLFDSFYYALTYLPLLNSFGANAPFITALILIVILEAALSSGFTAAVKIEEFRNKRKNKLKVPELKSVQ